MPTSNDSAAVMIITLDRPEQRNALTAQMCESLIEQLPLDPPSDRRCYLLTGAGPVFCAGADVAQVQGGEEALRTMMTRLQQQPLPVVAWLNGPAVGAGAYLAITSDYRVVRSGAYLRVPATRLGVGFSGSAIAEIVRRLGHPLGSRLLLAGEDVNAETLVQAGAAETAETFAEAFAFCERLADRAPLSVRGIRRGLQGDLQAADDLAASAATSADLREGIAAFRERRSPRFVGS